MSIAPGRQARAHKKMGAPQGRAHFMQDYSALGAETGHTPAHAPHSMQVSASITYLPSPSLIALTGHSAAHAPQLMQSSEILYAIVFHLPILLSRGVPVVF